MKDISEAGSDGISQVTSIIRIYDLTVENLLKRFVAKQRRTRKGSNVKILNGKFTD